MAYNTNPKTNLFEIAKNSEKIKQNICLERKFEDEKLLSLSDVERKNYLYEKYQKAEEYAIENQLGLDILNPQN